MALETTEHRVLTRFANIVDRWPRNVARLGAILTIPVLGLLDYASGPDVAFAALYLVPLSIVGWTSDDNHSFGRSATVLAALTWLAADLASGAEYSHPLVPAWNTLTRLVTFLIVVSLLQSLRAAFAEQQQLARTDPLTGIRNARAFMDDLGAEVRRARRHLTPLSVVYVDVDDFKSINDTLGHSGGDDVLKRIAKALDTHTREVDIVGRIGGDEFSILMPATDDAGALKVMAKLPARLAEAMDDLSSPVTLSTGCVTFIDPPAGVGEILHAADELMYEAKHGGKNAGRHRVVRRTESVQTG